MAPLKIVDCTYGKRLNEYVNKVNKITAGVVVFVFFIILYTHNANHPESFSLSVAAALFTAIISGIITFLALAFYWDAKHGLLP